MGSFVFKRLYGPSFNEELNCGVWRWAGGSAPNRSTDSLPRSRKADEGAQLPKGSIFQLLQALPQGPWDSSVDMSFSVL